MPTEALICASCGGRGDYEIYDPLTESIELMQCHACHCNGIQKNTVITGSPFVDPIKLAMKTLKEIDHAQTQRTRLRNKAKRSKTKR